MKRIRPSENRDVCAASCLSYRADSCDARRGVHQHDGPPLYGYWEFLGLAIGVACIVIGWRKTEDKRARRQIVVTQCLHWTAFLIAMNILLLPSVNTFLNGPATGLALMLLLALGTFVAGVHVSAEIAILGVVLALTVPAIAWLKQAALLLALAGLVVGALVVALRPQRVNENLA